QVDHDYVSPSVSALSSGQAGTRTTVWHPLRARRLTESRNTGDGAAHLSLEGAAGAGCSTALPPHPRAHARGELRRRRPRRPPAPEAPRGPSGTAARP